MGNCVRGVPNGKKAREVDEDIHKTESQVNSKILQPEKPLQSSDPPASDSGDPITYPSDNGLTDNTSQKRRADHLETPSRSREQCIKYVPMMTDKSIEQDLALSNNDFDHTLNAVEDQNCQTCTLLHERIQMLLSQKARREEMTPYSDHLTCPGIYDSPKYGTSYLLPQHGISASTSQEDTSFEESVYLRQNSQDDYESHSGLEDESHSSLEDGESDLYPVQDGPGTNWQFGYHYFNESREDETSTEDNTMTKDFFPDTSSLKFPMSDFLSISGKGISVEALGCEVTVGPQIGLSIFGNKIF